MYENIIVIDYLDREFGQQIEARLIANYRLSIQNWHELDTAQDLKRFILNLRLDGNQKIIHFLGHGAVSQNNQPYGFCRRGNTTHQIDEVNPDIPIKWEDIAKWIGEMKIDHQTHVTVNFMSVCHSHGIRNLFISNPFASTLYGTTGDVSMSKGFNIYKLNLNFELFLNGFGNSEQSLRYFKELGREKSFWLWDCISKFIKTIMLKLRK